MSNSQWISKQLMAVVVASGAGGVSQQAIGLAVVGGMTAATIMPLTITPVFYSAMQLHPCRRKAQT